MICWHLREANNFPVLGKKQNWYDMHMLAPSGSQQFTEYLVKNRIGMICCNLREANNFAEYSVKITNYFC